LRRRIEKTILPNGMRVISENVPSVGSISIGIWIHVGARDEPPKRNGVSHLIEHMIFKGTRKRSPQDIAQAVESLGGIINAFTGRENTCYYIRIRGEHLTRALEVLSDILNHSLFNPRDLSKERQVIIEEIKDVADTPSEYVHDLFMEEMYGSHPLGQPIMGKVDAIRLLRRPAVLKYFEEHYCSSNILVVATGAVNHRQLVDLTRKYFRWPESEARKDEEIPVPGKFSLKSVHDGTNQTHVCLGFPNIAFTDPDRYAISAANAYLSSGMSARLFQRVREDAGLCYNIYSYQEFFRDSGLFCVYFGADTKNVVKATNIVLKELHRLKEKLLSRTDVRKVKEQLKGSLMLSQESMYNRMNRIAYLELILGDYIDLDRNCEMIDGVTASKIREAANRIFDPRWLTFFSLGPMKKKELENVRWSAL